MIAQGEVSWIKKQNKKKTERRKKLQSTSQSNHRLRRHRCRRYILFQFFFFAVGFCSSCVWVIHSQRNRENCVFKCITEFSLFDDTVWNTNNNGLGHYRRDRPVCIRLCTLNIYQSEGNTKDFFFFGGRKSKISLWFVDEWYAWLVFFWCLCDCFVDSFFHLEWTRSG